MCGLSGVLDPDGRLSAERLASLAGAMADSLVHRGPDDSGVWQDPDAGLALGFRRLAVIDTSPAGHQPMCSASGRHVLAFNGEIYNFQALRKDLDSAGIAPPWRGHSDTEVLLALIEARGLAETLDRVEGMFAFALWDRVERRLSLVRDRFGEKPLYYGRIDGILAFASEPRAFRTLPGGHLSLDPLGVSLFLRHGWIPAPHSIFRGIAKLPPGHVLTVDSGTSKERLSAYWSAAEAAREARSDGGFKGTEDEALDRLEELMRQSIGQRLVADVPLGAFLSGGVDSSTVVALMAAMGAAPRSYTIGFPGTSKDESPHAEAVARHLGIEHTTIPMTEHDCLAMVPELAGIYDEPFADTSQIPTALLCRATRRHVTVALSGDGGDELFGGYPRYLSVAAQWRGHHGFHPPARRLAQAAVERLRGCEWPPLRRLRRKLRPHAAASPAALYRDALSWWHDDDGLGAAFGLTDGGLWDRAQDAVVALPDLARQFMVMDMALYLPDDLETKMDRAAMASSLEVRAPLLDTALARFAWSLDTDRLWQDGRGKAPLRRVLYRHVPPSLIDRPKQGFDPPLGAWLCGPLRDWADDLIGSDALSCDGLIDPRPVRRRWAEHRKGRRNWSFPLWVVLMLLSWRERWSAP